MSDLVFDKAIVTFTFLVTTPAETLRAALLARDPGAFDALSDEDKREAQKYLDGPQHMAQYAVSDLFNTVIEKTKSEKTWPQGSVVQIGFMDKEADAARLAPLRQKVENGELAGELVTVRLGITRDNKPFPGFTWLTSQIREEPANGLILLYTDAVQLPA